MDSGDDFYDVNVIVRTTGVIGGFQVPMSSLLPQATPSTAGIPRGMVYTAQYSAMVPQSMSSAPA